jgi:alcohol dehydrogenase (cytochrome c)
VVWETNVGFDTPQLRITRHRFPSRTRSSSGRRAATAACATGMAGLDAASGKLLWRKFTIPAPGEPGSETWKDRNNAWQTGGGDVWVTGTYDPDTNQTIWGTGNPVPMFDPFYRPGDNLYTKSAISWDPDTGNMNWYFQYTPGDLWNYDDVGTHIMIDSEVYCLGAQPARKAPGGQHPRAQRTSQRDCAVRVRAMKDALRFIATLAVSTAAAQALLSPMEAR